MPIRTLLSSFGRLNGTALASIGVLLLGSGCFDPFAGCGKITTPNWLEPGLYERFPAEGRKGDYAIRWVNGSMSGTKQKEAEDKNVIDDLGIDGKRLTVNETDHAHWTVTRPNALGSDETKRLFDSTFEELDLGTHPNRPTTFTWRTAPC